MGTNGCYSLKAGGKTTLGLGVCLDSSTGRGPGCGWTKEENICSTVHCAEQSLQDLPDQVLGSVSVPTCSPHPHVPHHGWSWRKIWRVARPREMQPAATWWWVLSVLPEGCREGRPGSCSTKINRESVVLDEVGLFSHSNTVPQVSGSEVSRKQDGYSTFSFLQQPVKQKRSGAVTHTGSVLVWNKTRDVPDGVGAAWKASVPSLF